MTPALAHHEVLVAAQLWAVGLSAASAVFWRLQHLSRRRGRRTTNPPKD